MGSLPLGPEGVPPLCVLTGHFPTAPPGRTVLPHSNPRLAPDSASSAGPGRTGAIRARDAEHPLVGTNQAGSRGSNGSPSGPLEGRREAVPLTPGRRSGRRYVPSTTARGGAPAYRAARRQAACPRRPQNPHASGIAARSPGHRPKTRAVPTPPARPARNRRTGSSRNRYRTPSPCRRPQGGIRAASPRPEQPEALARHAALGHRSGAGVLAAASAVAEVGAPERRRAQPTTPHRRLPSSGCMPRVIGLSSPAADRDGPRRPHHSAVVPHRGGDQLALPGDRRRGRRGDLRTRTTCASSSCRSSSRCWPARCCCRSCAG